MRTSIKRFNELKFLIDHKQDQNLKYHQKMKNNFTG